MVTTDEHVAQMKSNLKASNAKVEKSLEKARRQRAQLMCDEKARLVELLRQQGVSTDKLKEMQRRSEAGWERMQRRAQRFRQEFERRA